MLGKFFQNLFGSTEKSTEAPQDERLALAVLMVRLARTDYEYVLEERAEIVAILQRRYGLDDVAAEKLVDRAEEAEAQPHDNVYFTKQIKEMVAFDKRADVMEEDRKSVV